MSFVRMILMTAAGSFVLLVGGFWVINLQHLHLYVIQSGSMSPELPIGSVVIVDNQTSIISPTQTSNFQQGEIITYKKGKDTITHRIVTLESTGGQMVYRTKGDANTGVDLTKVEESQIVGRVIWMLPEVGRVLTWAKSSKGFTYLIIVPITILIYSEILVVRDEIKKILSRRNKHLIQSI